MQLQPSALLHAWDGLFGWKRRREAASTLRHARRFLTPDTVVLDIGSGRGYALDVLTEDYRITAFGCDVASSAHRRQRFAHFDGRRLPFADKSVDVALLIFVLHHAEEPSLLLREASRVARRAVLVVEDTPRTRFDRTWGRLHIHSFNKRHDIPWTGRLRDELEWHRLFAALGMPVQYEERLGRLERVPPVARTAFLLRPAMLPARVQRPQRPSRHAGRSTTT